MGKGMTQHTHEHTHDIGHPHAYGYTVTVRHSHGHRHTSTNPSQLQEGGPGWLPHHRRHAHTNAEYAELRRQAR